MNIPIIVRVECIPGAEASTEDQRQEVLHAVKEAMRIHWKTDLQHTRDSKCLLADFTVKLAE